MKYFLVICALLVTGLNFAGAKELPTNAITMEVKSMGVKDALQALLNDSGIKYKIAKTVNNDQKITMEVKEMKWSDAFAAIIENGHLTYSFDKKDVLQITTAKK